MKTLVEVQLRDIYKKAGNMEFERFVEWYNSDGQKWFREWTNSKKNWKKKAKFQKNLAKEWQKEANSLESLSDYWHDIAIRNGKENAQLKQTIKTQALVFSEQEGKIKHLEKGIDGWIRKGQVEHRSCRDKYEKKLSELKQELATMKESLKAIIEPPRHPLGLIADGLNECVKNSESEELKVGDMVITTNREWPLVGKIKVLNNDVCIVSYKDYDMERQRKALKKL